MTTFSIQKDWALRGYIDQPYCLEALSGNQPHALMALPPSVFGALRQCDGLTPMEPSKVTDAFCRGGFIEENAPPIAERQRYRYFDNPRRVSAQWAITGRCNYRCRHCFMSDGGDIAHGQFSLPDCQRIAAELADCGVREVELTGGEPLVHPQFLQIVEAILDAGLSVTALYTNGALLTQSLIDRLAARGVRPSIVISFDGIGSHGWMRGSEQAEEAALRAMRLAVQNGLTLRCAVNLNLRTLPTFMETCAFLRDVGASSLFVIRTSETPRWAKLHSEWSIDYPTYYETGLRLAQKMLDERWGIALQWFNGFLLPADGDLQAIIDQRDARQRSDRICRCAKANACVFIAHDGRVLPCDAFEGMSLTDGTFSIGNNLHDVSLRDALNHSDYADYFCLKTDDYLQDNPQCADCKWFPACHGGCRAVAYGASAWVGSGGYGNPLNNTYPPVFQCTFYRGGYADRLTAMAARAMQG